MSSFGGGGYQGRGGRGGNSYRGGGGRQNGLGGRPSGRSQGGRMGGGWQQQQQQSQQSQQSSEPFVYDLCRHGAIGSCTYGDNCRKAHSVTIGFNFQVHNNGANTIATISLPGDTSGQVPKIVTGGNDSTWKIWDVSQDPPAAISSYNATGIVRHVEVVDSTVLWSVDEPLTADQSAISVGTIYMLNPDGQSTTPIRRSTFMPCTHPMGEIRDFKVENIGGSVYVLSGGGEGVIHTWRFDGANKTFEHVTSFDSHFRAVTCLLFHDNKLWTGSTDQTLRLWNPATSQCERLMTCTHDAAGNASGHTGAVTCLILLPPTQQQQVAHIASGGLDGNMCIWSTTGDFVHQAGHDSEVICMATFYSDPNGIPLILLGLKNGSIIARSRNSMAGIFRIDSSIARRGGISAIYDMRVFRSFVVITDDGYLISWTIAEGLRDSA